MARRESRPSGRTHRRLAPQGIAAVHEEAVLVEKMAAGGEAIARLVDGRVVFVEGALPGETVRVAITTSQRDLPSSNSSSAGRISSSKISSSRRPSLVTETVTRTEESFSTTVLLTWREIFNCDSSGA
mgnify:CR=1 FL=1